jgi:hypothetical protein
VFYAFGDMMVGLTDRLTSGTRQGQIELGDIERGARDIDPELSSLS